MSISLTGPGQVAGTKATILLLSGELDKAIAAFVIAAGMAGMGMTIHMWFLLFGTNCLRKPVPWWSWRRWLNFGPFPDGPGRNRETDTAYQRVLHALLPTGTRQLPLSRLNFMGAGPALVRRILDRKHMAQLDELIHGCEDLGVTFTICQACVESMALSPTDFSVDVDVRGASSYVLEVAECQYNVVF